MRLVDYCNRRIEPRFHPGPQRVKWHSLDSAFPNRIGWLRDISLSGISFQAESVAELPVVKQRLEVQQFPGGKPSFYEVMWVVPKKGKCVLGCSQIFPSPRLTKARNKPLTSVKREPIEQECLAQAA